MISSNDVVNKKFDRAGFGGYKNEEVDTFLNEVASGIAELEEHNQVLTKKLEVLAEKLEEYRNDEESLRAALLGAQKLGDSIVRESKNKAELILQDANIKAERIIKNAQDQIEKEKMVYAKIQKDVASFKNRLVVIYRQHLELISNLPGEVSKEELKKSEPQQEEKEVKPPETKEELESTEVLKQEDSELKHREQKRSSPQEGGEEDEQYEPRIDQEENDFEEPSPRSSKKFIPIPRMNREKAAKKYEEYYEDEEDGEYSEEMLEQPEPPLAEDPHTFKKSKFGPLKFGAGYDLNRP